MRATWRWENVYARFDALAATWWDETGPMRVLHRFNPVRLAYIRDALCRRFGRDPKAPFPLDGLTICDVGCGGPQSCAQVGCPDKCGVKDQKGCTSAPKDCNTCK